MKKTFVIIIGFLTFCEPLFTQNNWNLEIRAGATISLNQSLSSWKQKGSGGNIFLAGSINKRLSSWSYFNYGTSLVLYTKSLGNSGNPLDNDVQIDFSHSFSIGAGKDTSVYIKSIRTLGNSYAYTLNHSFSSLFLISTNFIFNNNKRNQIIGSYSGTYKNFSFNYFNDGGPIIDLLPISDNFDRWWTGGVAVFIHDKDQFNKFEFTFDQFTGYYPLLYELSSIFGLNFSKYNYSETDTYTSKSYNSSTYNVRFSLDKYTHFNIGINGALRFQIGEGRNRKSTYFALQDLLHINKSALHPNTAPNKLQFGFNYSQKRDYYGL